MSHSGNAIEWNAKKTYGISLYVATHLTMSVIPGMGKWYTV